MCVLCSSFALKTPQDKLLRMSHTVSYIARKNQRVHKEGGMHVVHSVTETAPMVQKVRSVVVDVCGQAQLSSKCAIMYSRLINMGLLPQPLETKMTSKWTNT